MDWRPKSKQLAKVLMDENGPHKPTHSTISSEWTRTEGGSDGFQEASHSFLGIKLSVHRPINKDATIKFRIVNQSQYEPFLEEGERRVCDIIQVYPKEFVFEPCAALELQLPSCVTSELCGQLVCLHSGNLSRRHALKNLKWRPIDSYDFHVNATRTQARITCRQSGLYTVKITRHSQVTKDVDQFTECEVEIEDHPGSRMKFPSGSVGRRTRITLQTICVDDLYKLPAAAPVSSRLANVQLVPQGSNSDNLNTSDMIDVTSGPVVLVRPSRFRFARPIHLTLPLLGDQFYDFFAKENARIAVLRSKALDAEKITWQHHYSTPEIEVSPSGSYVASFLITRGGLYKIVRRFKYQGMRFLEQISACISRELRCSENHCNFATTRLRGLMTEIAEPGKQFILRAALFDASQPQNPDECFTREVCSQPLSLPLGKVRFLVRGSFEPDKDVTDNSEERTVTFTGKTTFVDFHLKLKLSDPTKLPGLIGKVTLFGEGDVVFYTTLHTPTKVAESDARSTNHEPRTRDKMKRPKYAQKRKTVAEFKNEPELNQFEPLTEDVEVCSLRDASLYSPASMASSAVRRSLPVLFDS